MFFNQPKLRDLTLDVMDSRRLPTRVSLDSIELISHWMLHKSILIALLNSDYVISLNLTEMKFVEMLWPMTPALAGFCKRGCCRRHCRSACWWCRGRCRTIHLGVPSTWNTTWRACRGNSGELIAWQFCVFASGRRVMSLTLIVCLRWSLHRSMCFLLDCISNPYYLKLNELREWPFICLSHSLCFYHWQNSERSVMKFSTWLRLWQDYFSGTITLSNLPGNKEKSGETRRRMWQACNWSRVLKPIISLFLRSDQNPDWKC